MSVLLGAVSLALAALLLGVFAHNLLVRRYDVLAWRNLFLLGFFHFYALGAYLTLVNPAFAWRFQPTERSMARLAWLMPLFLLVFWFTARWAYWRPWARRLFPKIEAPPSAVGLLMTSQLLLAASLAAVLAPPGGYIGLLAAQFKGGMAASAIGLSAYYLFAKKFSPMAWGIFLFTLAAGAFATTVGGSGRRALLAALLGAPWMWYWFILRYRPARGMVVKIGALAVLGVVVLAAYNNVRQQGGSQGLSADVRKQQAVELLRNPNLSKHNFDLMLYTDTTINTLYLLEHVPQDIGYMPFNGLAFILSNPVPRAVWPDKPVALGIQLQEKMGTAANLGPGVIGHGWAEGNALGVVLYAMFFGLFVGFGDAALRDRATNPYFIAAMGSGLGNMIGLPRGDTPLFLLQILASLFASFAGMQLIMMTLRPYFHVGRPLLLGGAVEAYATGRPLDEEEQQQAA